MRRHLSTITKASFLVMMALNVVDLACGGSQPILRQQAPTANHPEIPRNTVERLQECVREYGQQLDGGSWAFSPMIQVDQEGYVDKVNAGDIPQSAPDLAACTRIALGDMVIPAQVFNLRSAHQNTETNEPTVEQRSQVANPAVAVIVVVGLSEIVLEAGAVTILFAVTVKVVDKAVDDVTDLLKRRPPITGGEENQECTNGYVRCIGNGGGRSLGNNWNTTICENCLRVCKSKGGWPYGVPIFGKGLQLCY